nr:DUF444 family protein [Paraburkholderia fungorum]
MIFGRVKNYICLILLYLSLKCNYERIELVFIRHLARAEEDMFFRSTESNVRPEQSGRRLHDGVSHLRLCAPR